MGFPDRSFTLRNNQLPVGISVDGAVYFYKIGKAKDDPTLDQMLCDGFETVLSASKELPTLNEEEMSAKRKLCKDYSDGLISNGGISTDVFKEQLGEDTTRDFFDKVLFGTEHYGN